MRIKEERKRLVGEIKVLDYEPVYCLIYLYNEIPKEELDLGRVLAYLGDKCPFAEVAVRSNFVAHFFSPELLCGLAGAWDIELSGERGADLSPIERLDYEQQAYLQPERISSNIVYNGWQLLELLGAQIPHQETSLSRLHLILTPRLLVTKDEGERRDHARTILCGQPSVVSSSGLVEAPARPVEYYLLERAYQSLGQELPESEIKERFGGQFLTYHDPRLTEVMLGYILQAIAYHVWGEGFCDDPHCRLHNAHRQREMLTAQLSSPEFCSRHQALFRQF